MSDFDALTLGLLQQETSHRIDPGSLSRLGKEASVLYLSDGTNLTDAVVEVSKHASLNTEQIKRVCEYANTEAYLREFEKGASIRNITFEGGPANPSDAIKALNDGSTPAVQQLRHNDYGSPVHTHYKVAGVSMEKVASVQVDHLSHANPVEDLYDLRMSLESARDHFISKIATSGVLLDDVRGALCKHTDKEIRGGSSPGEVISAWRMSGDEEAVKKAASMTGLTMTKTASTKVLVNPKHPVVDTFVAFTKIAKGHRMLEASVQILDERLHEVNASLRNML